MSCSYLAFTPRHFLIVEHIYDKARHVAAFLVLAGLTDFAFPRSRFDWRKVLWLLAYGLLIEVVQYFLPYRSAELLDWLADAVGIACYVLMIPGLRRIPIIQRRWREMRGPIS